MNEQTTLPDPKKFFGIRFESLGGLGAHTAGQILATTAVLRMNLNGAHFSSFGSEQKGSLVRSFIRLAPPDKPIRSNTPIDSPDVIVVFHSALFNDPMTIAGMKANGVLIYNGADGEKLPALLSRLPSSTKVIRVDAQKIALKEKSKINAVLLGAMSAAMPFLDFSMLLETFSEKIAQRYPDLVVQNEKAFRRGAKEIETLSHIGQANGDLPIKRAQPIFGYETAPIGGVLTTPGNTVSNDVSALRWGWVPVFDPKKCVHCGVCDIVCPDFCLVWKPGENGEMHLQGIDYRYCKGCLRCVESCSTGTLRRKKETPGLVDQLQVNLFEGGL